MRVAWHPRPGQELAEAAQRNVARHQDLALGSDLEGELSLPCPASWSTTRRWGPWT